MIGYYDRVEVKIIQVPLRRMDLRLLEAQIKKSG